MQSHDSYKEPHHLVRPRHKASVHVREHQSHSELRCRVGSILPASTRNGYYWYPPRMFVHGRAHWWHRATSYLSKTGVRVLGLPAQLPEVARGRTWHANVQQARGMRACVYVCIACENQYMCARVLLPRMCHQMMKGKADRSHSTFN